MAERVTADKAADQDHFSKWTVLPDTHVQLANHSPTDCPAPMDLQSHLDSAEYLRAAEILHPDSIR